MNEFGNVIDSNELQSKKTSGPIVVTEFGIVIYGNVIQLWNAPVPIVVTEFGIVIDVNALQFLNRFILILVNDKLLGNVIDTNELQSKKALEPIVVTVFPILAFFKLIITGGGGTSMSL